MEASQKEIHRIFGNKLRIRVCGICFEENKILLIRHHNIGKQGYLWAPPGGGMEFGENAEECLKREMLEETGLDVSIKRMMFVNEYISHPLHAIELFFETEITGGQLITGKDPEMPEERQLISDASFIDLDTIRSMDKQTLHNLFNYAESKDEILRLNGYFFQNSQSGKTNPTLNN